MTTLIAALSIALGSVTLLWLALFLWDVRRKSPVETFESAITHSSNRDWPFRLGYANAVIITVACTMLFAALYVYLKDIQPVWAVVGLVFVPVYSVLNLFVYLSQITVIPRLFMLRDSVEEKGQIDLLIAQFTHVWPGSVVALLNGLAYAVLGIPSIIFGIIMFSKGTLMATTGTLLLLNGVACIAGLMGWTMRNPVLSMGTVVGGAVFLIALVPMAVAFLRL